MKFKKWLKWIRLPNLVVVAMTQYLLFFLFVREAISNAGLIMRVDDLSFHLLVIVTILITASGYLINDILDEDIDRINHPHSDGLISSIGREQARYWYYSLSGIGLILATYIAFRTHYLAYIWIYPLAVGLLYMYSARFKLRPFIGNILVSLFCAGVAYLMLFIEHENLATLHSIRPQTYLFLQYLILFYCAYAFLTNYIRELIKDAQDIKGDKIAGAKTFPILYGVQRTHFFISVLSLTLIIFIGCWMYQTVITISMANITYLVLTVILPIIYINMAIYRNDRNYKQLSLLSKLIMLAGLINLLFYTAYLS